MPRLLHMADVHLGARHQDLGDAAVQQRERQFAAFKRAIDMAIHERADVVLVAGDLFDSNSQPRRTVERVAAEFGRLAAKNIRTVILPGTHDVYDGASIYRAYDLAAMAGVAPTSDLLTVLTPELQEVLFPALDLVVYGRCFATKRAPASPLAGFSALTESRARWRVGIVHGALRVPGRVERDEVMFTEDEIVRSGLDYLALGHWHSARRGRAGGTAWAYSGAVEPVAVDQEGAGFVVLAHLEEIDGQRHVRLEARQVGKTKFQKLDLDASEIGSQQRLVQRLLAMADPNLVLDVRLTGIEPDTLELNDDELDQQLRGAFLRYRIRNAAVPPALDGPRPPADTIAGAFVEDLELKIDAAETAGASEVAAELRESLRLGRLLLEDANSVQLV
jgi:exonuclease SbcD